MESLIVVCSVKCGVLTEQRQCRPSCCQIIDGVKKQHPVIALLWVYLCMSRTSFSKFSCKLTVIYSITACVLGKTLQHFSFLHLLSNCIPLSEHTQLLHNRKSHEGASSHKAFCPWVIKANDKAILLYSVPAVSMMINHLKMPSCLKNAAVSSKFLHYFVHCH